MIRQPQISFFGFLYGKNGVSPDPKKIQGILEMPHQADVTQLQSLFGMINFMDYFIPPLVLPHSTTSSATNKEYHIPVELINQYIIPKNSSPL